MKRILILRRHSPNADYGQKDEYMLGMASLDAKCTYIYGEFERLVFSYDGATLRILLDGRDIAEYDGILLIDWFKIKMIEDMALCVAYYMHHHGLPVFNSEALHTRSRSKLSQYVVAALHDIRLTPFFFCMDKALYVEALEQYWQGGYPLILKATQASRGRDNYLLHSAEDVRATIESVDKIEGPWFVCQGYVPNEGDYRILVMGDAVAYVIYRQAQTDTHLNNTSQGGLATEVPEAELPERVKADSIRLAKLLHREVTGVDMIRHKETGEYYLLEINNLPQLSSGAFVREKLTALDAYFDRATTAPHSPEE